MNFYVENKSYSFMKKAFNAVLKNTNNEINKGYIINYKGGCNKKGYYFFKRKGVYDIEYVIYGCKGLRKAIKLLNLNKNPISLTLVIDKLISKKNKKIILTAKKSVKIIDISKLEDNISFYKTSKKIVYSTTEEDNILHIDMMHIYKFYETALQCKFSSCLGKNFYVRKNGDVHFCPKYLDKSKVGNINCDEKYMENQTFLDVLGKAIEKREGCKNNCKYFDYCLGACPMEEGCSDFPQLFEVNKNYIDDIILNNKDLNNENLIVSKIVIKDIVYDE